MAPSSRSRARTSTATTTTTEPPAVKDESRRRVTRACDSCRVRKTKCDGDKPCMKCANENQVCTYTQCKKPTGRVFSPEYVELLESKVKLLSSSLAILAEVVSEGKDLSHLAQDPDTPINELVDKLQAMGTKQKATGPAYKRETSGPIQNDIVETSPAKQAKLETGQGSPILRNETVRYGSPALNHKSPSALSTQETSLDFSDTTDSPIFEEPSSVHDYPVSFAAPMLTPQEFSESQPSVAKLMQVSPEIRDDFPRSPSSMYGTPMTQYVPTKAIHDKSDSSFTLSNHSGSPYSQVSSYEPNISMCPPRLAPVAQQRVNTPPFTFDTMNKDEFNDILADGTEDFLQWQ